ncbi:MAG: hypothetical protein LC798_18565 [Chloroflexi bacterium]|nr:hypothetical protein [Chloroflexota bacterium]
MAGLALLVLLASAVGVVAVMAVDRDPHWVVVSDRTGGELARASIAASDGFALRYRNSVYESIAEEQFEVLDGDQLNLVELRADELAVLEEYYTAVGATRSEPGADRTWRIGVERPSIALPLRVQATALGQRTLLASGQEIELWRLVADRDDTLVVLTIEGSE